MIRKYATGSAHPDQLSAKVTCAITASRITEASPAPHVMVLFDDLSLNFPETCPPRMAAAPEAMRKGPSPESSPSPRSADSDTKKRALNLLKGKDEGVLGNLLGGVDIADTVEDVLGDVLGGLLGNK